MLIFNGEKMALPRCQHDLVESLVRAEGRALTNAHLAGCLGGEIYDQSIAVYVGRARAMLKTIDPGFDQIDCVRGFGAYKWVWKAPEAPMHVRANTPSATQLGSSPTRETIQ